MRILTLLLEAQSGASFLEGDLATSRKAEDALALERFSHRYTRKQVKEQSQYHSDGSQLNVLQQEKMNKE